MSTCPVCGVVKTCDECALHNPQPKPDWRLITSEMLRGYYPEDEAILARPYLDTRGEHDESL